MKNLHCFLLVAFSVIAANPLFPQTFFTPVGTTGAVTNGSTNVGIGTSTPAYRLTVEGTSNSLTFRAHSPGDFIFALAGDGSAGSNLDLLSIRNNNTGVVHLNTLQSARLALGVSTGANAGTTVEQMTITSAGKVGIGTTSPAVRLDVMGATSAFPAASGTSQAGASARLGNSQTNGVLDIGVNSGGGAWLQYTNQTDLSQNYPLLLNPNGGYVGVGTTSPAVRLDVAGTTSAFPAASGTSQPGASARLGNSQTNGVLDVGVNSGGGAWLQYTNKIDLSQNLPLLLNPNGGNVGIGTTSPTHKLSVNGTIRAKEVIVDTGWSDYVFKPDYKLASLSEVEGAIQRDGHLPGIPSAQEVAEHGVSMGEMQSKLLAKIEELTLHQIAQEKRIEQLTREVISLRQTNNP